MRHARQCADVTAPEANTDSMQLAGWPSLLCKLGLQDVFGDQTGLLIAPGASRSEKASLGIPPSRLESQIETCGSCAS